MLYFMKCKVGLVSHYLMGLLHVINMNRDTIAIQNILYMPQTTMKINSTCQLLVYADDNMLG